MKVAHEIFTVVQVRHKEVDRLVELLGKAPNCRFSSIGPRAEPEVILSLDHYYDPVRVRNGEWIQFSDEDGSVVGLGTWDELGVRRVKVPDEQLSASHFTCDPITADLIIGVVEATLGYNPPVDDLLPLERYVIEQASQFRSTCFKG